MASLASLALPVTIDYPSGNCTLVAGQLVSIRWHFTNPSWHPTGSGLRITVTMAQGSTVFMVVVDNKAPLVQWPMPVSQSPGLYIVWRDSVENFQSFEFLAFPRAVYIHNYFCMHYR